MHAAVERARTTVGGRARQRRRDANTAESQRSRSRRRCSSWVRARSAARSRASL